MSPEVLIYIQKVKMYLENDQSAYDYFLGGIDYDKFFEELGKIATTNIEKKGEPSLTQNQFELVKTLCSSKDELKNKDKNDSSTIYLDLGSFGKLYMN
jgi:hypothetical protein